MKRKLSLQYQHKQKGLQTLEAEGRSKSGKQIIKNEKISKLKIDEIGYLNESEKNINK